MESHQTMESKVSDAAVIRAVFPRHPVKRLARLLGLPIGTAHEWTYRHLSAARRRELAMALLEEFDRQDREERAAVRSQLQAMVGDMVNEMGSSSAGGSDRADNAQPQSMVKLRRIGRRLAKYAAS